MAVISRTSFVTGDILTSTQWNTQFDTVYNEFNGNIDNANIKASAAIDLSKLALSGQIASAVTKAGVTDGSAATAGTVGEYQSASGTGSAPTSATYGDMGSLTLAAGDWDLNLQCYMFYNGCTWTTDSFLLCGIGTASGTSNAGLVTGSTLFALNVNGAGLSAMPERSASISGVRALISASTTYYAKLNVRSYSVATPTYAYRMSARRMR